MADGLSTAPPVWPRWPTGGAQDVGLTRCTAPCTR